MTKTVVIGALFGVLSLAGCGQKGPLFLPGQGSGAKAAGTKPAAGQAKKPASSSPTGSRGHPDY